MTGRENHRFYIEGKFPIGFCVAVLMFIIFALLWLYIMSPPPPGTALARKEELRAYLILSSAILYFVAITFASISMMVPMVFEIGEDSIRFSSLEYKISDLMNLTLIRETPSYVILSFDFGSDCFVIGVWTKIPTKPTFNYRRHLASFLFPDAGIEFIDTMKELDNNNVRNETYNKVLSMITPPTEPRSDHPTQ